MDYITVLYRGYKKVIKTLMYFSPPTKCFYEDALSNIPHAIFLRQRASTAKFLACLDLILSCSKSAF